VLHFGPDEVIAGVGHGAIVEGSVAANTVPPVTLPPAFILAITGFQTETIPQAW